MSHTQVKEKISVLHDNPPLSGKKFFLVSMISPESNQKHDIYGFKLHDVCETEEQGRKLCSYYNSLDPDFDIYLASVGKWLPWCFDPTAVTEAEYANEQLTNLIRGHREQTELKNQEWEKNLVKCKEAIKYEGSKEGQEESSRRKEVPESLYFKIKQLENLINSRNSELSQLKERYANDYTESERTHAESLELPISEIAPMQYELLGSTEI